MVSLLVLIALFHAGLRMSTGDMRLRLEDLRYMHVIYTQFVQRAEILFWGRRSKYALFQLGVSQFLIQRKFSSLFR